VALGNDFPSVLAAAKTGAECAVARLYREFQPRLLRYLQAREPGDADDLASETWIAAARGLARFEGDEGDFARWLFTIASRRVTDHRRSRARRRESVPLDEIPEPANRSDPTYAFEQPALEQLRAHLSRLPPAQAEVVLLRVVADLDVADVAAVMGKTPGAIRVLQHRALERLADLLAADESFVTP
jgi:RNA polymerase sigma-70 factor (ECF subfamily)